MQKPSISTLMVLLIAKARKIPANLLKEQSSLLDVVNSIAVAKVQVKMYEFNYDEFLSFHKIDNRWLIVNKMITDVD